MINIDPINANISWEFFQNTRITGLTDEFVRMINYKWNGPYGMRVLASVLSYVENMPKNVPVFGASLDKKYFRCRNLAQETIEVKLGFDKLGLPIMNLTSDDIVRTYQYINSPEDKKIFINLISFGYRCSETSMSRFLCPNIFQAFLDRKDEHLGIFMIDAYNKSSNHLILHDEEKIFKNISNLKSLHNIPEICAYLYHNNGQQILDNIIEIGNYDGLDDNGNMDNLAEGFKAKIQNCELVYYEETRLIRLNCFVTLIANLINGEYNFSYKSFGFTDTEETAIKEEIEAYMAENKIQVNEISEGLKKKLG